MAMKSIEFSSKMNKALNSSEDGRTEEEILKDQQSKQEKISSVEKIKTETEHIPNKKETTPQEVNKPQEFTQSQNDKLDEAMSLLDKKTPTVETPKSDTGKPTMPSNDLFNNLNNFSVPIQEIKKIINSYKSYSALEENTKLFIKFFLNLTNDAKEEEIIHGILNVSEQELLGIKDLIELKQTDSTSRAFGLVSLTNERLMKLNHYTEIFTQKAHKQVIDISDKIEYCRALEQGISMIKETVISNLITVYQTLSKGSKND